MILRLFRSKLGVWCNFGGFLTLMMSEINSSWRNKIKPILIFVFFDFDVSLYLHFSPKTPQWGLKMTIWMLTIDFLNSKFSSFFHIGGIPKKKFWFFLNVAEVAILCMFVSFFKVFMMLRGQNQKMWIHTNVQIFDTIHRIATSSATF